MSIGKNQLPSQAEMLGAMNKRITLMDEVRTFAAGGRPVISYPVIETVWAAISSRYHAPVVRGEGVEFPTTINFIIHYSDRFQSVKRIEWDTRYFSVISSADVDGDNRFLEIRTREINTA